MVVRARLPVIETFLIFQGLSDLKKRRFQVASLW